MIDLLVARPSEINAIPSTFKSFSPKLISLIVEFNFNKSDNDFAPEIPISLSNKEISLTNLLFFKPSTIYLIPSDPILLLSKSILVID